MPRVKSFKSLTENCMNLILENQEFFCTRFTPGELKDDVDALLDSEKPVNNPFDEIPNELLQELMRLLRDKESSRAKDKFVYPYGSGHTYKITSILKLLMTPHLRTLDLTLIKNGSDISEVLHLATIRSPHLETLLLDPTSHQFVKRYSFIPKFTKLRILEISFPDASDDCFELIGSHCPDLRELYCCHLKLGGNDSKVTDDAIHVTDDGIRMLCVDGYCKSIRILDLSGCSKITTKGIQLAFENLPQLRVLRHKSLLECLAEIAQTATDQKLTLPKYSLSTIEIGRYSVYKNGYLRQAVRLCPNVTRLYLELWKRERFEETDLLSLLSLEKLYGIYIGHAEYEYNVNIREIRVDRGLTFNSVVPLLKKFGCCLISLHVEDFFVVEIPTIMKFCPNLESLKIENFKTNQTTVTTLERPIILQNLKKLTLWKCFNISTEHLFALLSSPSLSYLNLSDCDALTDNILQRAANLHSYRNLEHLILDTCKSVTKKGIDIFMQESNPLRRIDLLLSPAITHEDINDWNDNAIWIKKNWQFIFYICTCNRNISIGGNRNFWENFT